MKIIFKIFVLLLIECSSLSAQNLVPNQSFEDAWSCPDSYTTIVNSKPYPMWINPNKGTPDQLHICSVGDAGVPENFAGTMYPNEGVAYAGIILREVFFDTTKIVKGVSREYIQTKLIKPLEKEKLYCVKLFYANSSKSLFSVDALGITLTKDNIGTKDAGLIIQRPQIINKPGNIMDNFDFWQELCGIYRARGNEKFLTIGNFWDNSLTNYKLNTHESVDSNFIYAYYYIDDVRVFEIENPFECGCLNDLSFGSDWMSEKYNPETGYNNLDTDLLTNNKENQIGYDGQNIQANSTGTNENTNAADNNIKSNNSTQNGINGKLSNEVDKDNGYNNSDPMSFIAMKESEITDEAFTDVQIGDKFNLNRIFFEFNSYDLLTVSYLELDKLYELLQSKPSLRIEIRGHTDNIGSNSYNKTLSIKRAESVYNYLIDKGVDKSKMKYRGFGNKVPIADNETEEGRILNRRVEIIIVGL